MDRSGVMKLWSPKQQPASQEQQDIGHWQSLNSPASIMESRRSLCLSLFPLSLSPARSLSLSKLPRVPLGPQAGSKASKA